jgi:uncharacterized membrane protein YkoI
MKTQSKSRFSRLMAVTLAGTVAFSGLGAMFANAASERKDETQIQALSSTKLTLSDAIRTVESAGQGVVTGAEFDMNKDSTWYEVTMQKGSSEVDYRVNPMTGAIIDSSSDAEESDGDSDADEAKESSEIQTAKFSILQAVSQAEAKGGKVLGAEFEKEDGALAIQLEVADAAGAVSERMFTADTGTAIKGDQDHSQDKDDEEHGGSEESHETEQRDEMDE